MTDAEGTVTVLTRVEAPRSFEDPQTRSDLSDEPR